MLFEACVDSVVSARAAAAGGAHRLELCDSLVEGGITPSIGKIAAVVKAVNIPVHVLIRPRGGDFCYDEDELSVMESDIHECARVGASGVVFGILLPDGQLDVPIMRRLLAITQKLHLSVTFHRAIDVSGNPMKLLEDCIALGGVHRILTSGAAVTALEGAALIHSLVRAAAAAGNRIQIIAGGGVTAENVARLIELTGVTEVHGTGGRRSIPGRMLFQHDPIIYMGAEKRNTPDVEYDLRIVTSENVHEIVKAMSQCQRQTKS